MNSQRLHQLAAIVDSHLHQFEEIPLNSSTSGDCYPSYTDRGPTLYVSGRKDSKVYDLPKDGKASINYRIRSKSVNYRDDGSESYSTDIEVQSIEAINDSQDDTQDDDDKSELSAILDKYDFDDRARDDGGRYSPGVNVSSDDMATAYLKPKKKALLVGAGLAGLATAAASPTARTAIAGGLGRLVRRTV